MYLGLGVSRVMCARVSVWVESSLAYTKIQFLNDGTRLIVVRRGTC
jgi:hypothetical protein